VVLVGGFVAKEEATEGEERKNHKLLIRGKPIESKEGKQRKERRFAGVGRKPLEGEMDRKGFGSRFHQNYKG